METDGLSFPEAVERLAAHAGLEVPKATPEDRARVERARGLGDVVEAACRWYQDNLAGPEGAAARAYLKRRRLADRTIAIFRPGSRRRVGELCWRLCAGRASRSR